MLEFVADPPNGSVQWWWLWGQHERSVGLRLGRCRQTGAAAAWPRSLHGNLRKGKLTILLLLSLLLFVYHICVIIVFVWFWVLFVLEYTKTNKSNNSQLIHWEIWMKFYITIFKVILVINDWSISCEIACRWLSLNLTDANYDKSTLVQVMAWCHLATSQYLSQCWQRSLSYITSLGHNVFMNQSIRQA